jgi:hypothetical protein
MYDTAVEGLKMVEEIKKARKGGKAAAGEK